MKTVKDTSLLSFVELNIEGKIKGRQLEYLKALASYGKPATDLELTKFVGKADPNYFRPRRNELVKDLMIIAISKRKCNISNKLVYSWYFTVSGYNLILELLTSKEGGLKSLNRAIPSSSPQINLKPPSYYLV